MNIEIAFEPTPVRKREREAPSGHRYAAAVNRRQRAYLRGLAWRAFPVRRPVQHDFGGGGRGIRLMQGMVRWAHGYDQSPVPEPASTDLPAVVTAFGRPGLPEPANRERAVAFAARVLPYYSSGLLIVENHRECRPDEIVGLLDRHGFAVVEWRGFALLPPRWYRPRWLRPVARLVDDAACRMPPLHRWARAILYVARRVHAGSQSNTS